jgi:hypothetical protein
MSDLYMNSPPLDAKGVLGWDSKRDMALQAALALTVAAIEKGTSSDAKGPITQLQSRNVCSCLLSGDEVA